MRSGRFSAIVIGSKTMRIISGEFGGRLIEAPPGQGTRPMLDRVREAMFSTLGDRFDGQGVLDLFAGTGSLGLESISRGAVLARMVELDARVVKLLQANIASLGVKDRTRVLTGDAISPAVWKDPGCERYSVIFCDPPYPMLRDGPSRKRVLEALGRLAAERLAEDGEIVFHAPRGLLQSGEFRGLDARERAYGTSALWSLSRGSAATEPA